MLLRSHASPRTQFSRALAALPLQLLSSVFADVDDFAVAAKLQIGQIPKQIKR